MRPTTAGWCAVKRGENHLFSAFLTERGTETDERGRDDMGTPNVSMQALLAEVLRSGASDLHLSVGFRF